MDTRFPPDLDAFVREEVAAGRYLDQDDLIRDAVRRLADARSTQEAALRIALAPGLKQSRAGEYVAGDVMDVARRARGE